MDKDFHDNYGGGKARNHQGSNGATTIPMPSQNSNQGSDGDNDETQSSTPSLDTHSEDGELQKGYSSDERTLLPSKKAKRGIGGGISAGGGLHQAQPIDDDGKLKKTNKKISHILRICVGVSRAYICLFLPFSSVDNAILCVFLLVS